MTVTDALAELTLLEKWNFIEEFKSTVDRVLSISNARTAIEIPD